MLIYENKRSGMPQRGRSEGELVLAVDSGGTKTSCTLARLGGKDRWTILGKGCATSGNPRANGIAASARAISDSVKLAKAEAGLDSFPCHRGLFAVAGTLHEPIRKDLNHCLMELELAEECFVVPDLIPPVVGCSPTVSMALIAGTGAVAVGCDSLGRLAIAGGWGHLLGDGGSGFALGRAAIRATLSTLESGETPRGMVDQVCQTMGAYSSLEMKAVFADATDLRELAASLAPIVLSPKYENDSLCVSIIVKAASDLAELIQSLKLRLQIQGDTMSIALSGGILRADSPLTCQLAKELGTRGFQAEFHRIDDPSLPILNMLADPEMPTQYEILP